MTLTAQVTFDHCNNLVGNESSEDSLLSTVDHSHVKGASIKSILGWVLVSTPRSETRVNSMPLPTPMSQQSGKGLIYRAMPHNNGPTISKDFTPKCHVT